MNRLLFFFGALAALTACAPKQAKVLVLYYSQNGTTEVVAREIAAQTGADIERFDVTAPYDGSYDETIARCLKERGQGFVPTVRPIESDLSKYDIIFLGFPIWFGTYAPPVAALLSGIDLDGKTVVPFCTFGSGGLESSSRDLKNALPASDIREGYGIRAARIGAAAQEIERFLILGGFKTGDVEIYPEFSEQKPMDETLLAIFDAACGSYPMPLGKPLSAGSRQTSKGTEYLYIVQSKDRDGNPVSAKIYISVGAEDGAAAEFTRVVR